jgi:hypothetical protein
MKTKHFKVNVDPECVGEVVADAVAGGTALRQVHGANRG